ncbi:hypothetical protein [Streptococcus sp. FT1-106]
MRNKINLEAKLAYEKMRGEKNKFGSYHMVLIDYPTVVVDEEQKNYSV